MTFLKLSINLCYIFEHDFLFIFKCTHFWGKYRVPRLVNYRQHCQILSSCVLGFYLFIFSFFFFCARVSATCCARLPNAIKSVSCVQQLHLAIATVPHNCEFVIMYLVWLLDMPCNLSRFPLPRRPAVFLMPFSFFFMFFFFVFWVTSQ